MELKIKGLIPFRFANALDGKPIVGGKVAIEGIGDFVTDREGIITFPERADGRFFLVFSKQGFITTEIDFEVINRTLYDNRYSISPDMPFDGYFRIILDWGERPADLDLHFEKAGGYHISYRNMQSADDGSTRLDRDDVTSFGPETITVAQTDQRSVYHLYVIDFTNSSNGASRALSASGAVIRVYNRDRLLQTFRVPEGSPGNRWNVFKIVNGTVVPE
jgi:hypothetical protein